jgi:hypothetical protein
MGACLTTGGVASHRTAAALWQLDGFPVGVVEIVLPRGERVRRTSAIVHESRDLAGVDFADRDGIPCTSLVRTLVDLPALCSAAHAGKGLDSAVRRDPRRELLGLVLMRHREVARRGRPGTRKLRALLAERLGTDQRTDSSFEDEFLGVCRAFDIPEPVTQYRVRLPDGSIVYLDAAWPPSKVYVECDSLAHHFGKVAFDKDRRRRRALVAMGWRPYEYTWWDVHLAKRTVADEIRAALGLPRWSPT